MISHTLNNRKRGKYFLFGDKLRSMYMYKLNKSVKNLPAAQVHHQYAC